MSLRRLTTFGPAMVSAALTIAGLVLFGLVPREKVPVGLHLEESFPFIFMQLSLGAVGAVVAWRQSRNPIGWLLSAGGLAAGVEFLAAGYMTYGLLSEGGLPWADVVSWFWSWGATLVGLCVVPVLFIFPDGHLRSRQARVGIVLGVLATIAIALVISPRAGPMLGIQFAENPFGWREGARLLDIALVIPLTLGLAAFAFGASALRSRYQTANDLERQQLKWLFGGVALWAATYTIVTPAFFSEAFGVVVDPLIPYLGRIGAAVGFSIVPVVIGIAILRYRLYEIDMLIKRTVVYATTSAAVAATFLLGILTLQGILRPLTSGSELAIAATTLVSFALFQPIRRRVQDAVNRHFDRSRYDATRTLDTLADRLRDEVDLASLRAELLGAVRQTMSPSHASLWLRSDLAKKEFGTPRS
jgi:hypothetical protein